VESWPRRGVVVIESDPLQIRNFRGQGEKGEHLWVKGGRERILICTELEEERGSHRIIYPQRLKYLNTTQSLLKKIEGRGGEKLS